MELAWSGALPLSVYAVRVRDREKTLMVSFFSAHRSSRRPSPTTSSRHP